MIRLFEAINLTDRNSFHVRQSAERLVEFDTAADVAAIFEQWKPARWMVLSGGNNILFTRDYEGLLLTPVSQQIQLLEEQDDEVVMRADAGVEWDDLVAWAVERDLWGLENLSLIPGKVGAAPVQNIGAYGAEAKDAIRAIHWVDTAEGCRERVMAVEEAQFGYRESIFKHALKGRAIITAVDFALHRTPQPRIGYGDVEREVMARGGVSLRNIREAICAIRRFKLPDTAVLGNAGSFFKNPVVERAVAEALLAEWPEMPHYATADPERIKLAAGWLIDRAGLKGYRRGAVGVHERQALVLVNHGGATGEEVIALADYVIEQVQARFGIRIEPEVNIL